MGKGYGVAHLAEQAEQPFPAEGSFGFRVAFAQTFDDGLERLSLDQLHAVKRKSVVVLTHGMDRHDVWMRQITKYFCFPSEPWIPSAATAGNFDGHFPLQLWILPLVDAAHPAPCNFRTECVLDLNAGATGPRRDAVMR